jgi:DNA helicase IV
MASRAHEHEQSRKEEGTTSQADHLMKVADHTLTFLEETAKTARERLGGSNPSHSVGYGGVLATSANTMTGDRAVQKLDEIDHDQLRELTRLASEPAIARIVLGENGKEQVYFISRAGTLPTSATRTPMASYRSPIGRLAAMRVGQDEDVRTPQGYRNYELRERAALRPIFKSLDGIPSTRLSTASGASLSRLFPCTNYFERHRRMEPIILMV